MLTFIILFSVLRYLAIDVKCFTLFATHFHELTRLSETIPTLKNQHVTAITLEDSLILMYQVKPGACDQSFGIHVAKMARFPTHVVEVNIHILDFKVTSSNHCTYE